MAGLLQPVAVCQHLQLGLPRLYRSNRAPASRSTGGRRGSVWRPQARRKKGPEGAAGGDAEQDPDLQAGGKHPSPFGLPTPMSQQELEALARCMRHVAEQQAAGQAATGDRVSSAIGGAPGSSNRGAAEVAGVKAAGAALGVIPVEYTPADPFPGAEPELVIAAELVAATAEEVLYTAEQLTTDVVSDAADVASATQVAAKDAQQQAVQNAAQLAVDVVSDAADMAGAAKVAAAGAQQQAVRNTEQVAADVASNAADLAGAAQVATEDVQQQAVRNADLLVSGTASDAEDVVAALQTAAADAQRQALRNAQQLVADVASDAADMAGAMQSVAEVVEQQAAKAAGAAGMATAPPPPPPNSSAAAPPPPPAAPAAALSSDRAADIARVKALLVSMLASLDRGAAATEDEARRVDGLARQLETLGGAVVLSWENAADADKPSMALLDGRWRLLYSSGFTSGSLGGRRPGPAIGASPVSLGQVFQDIATDTSELDNVVDLFLRLSLAALPGINAATPTAVARLEHSFRVVGANTIEITFIDTEVKLSGGLQGWLDQLPTFTVPQLPEWLQPPKSLRSARFDVVFLDEQMRVTRGDRGELRVFVKGEA